MTQLIGGTWTIGEWHWGRVEEKEAKKVCDLFLEKYRFIDTAPVYGFGKAERLIGEVLKNIDRKSVKIMTKFGLNTEGGEFFFQTIFKGKEIKVYKRADRESIKEECLKSLERLNTDYIDIYLLHFKPSAPSIIEIGETLEELKDKGLIKEWGVCNINTGEIHKLISYKLKPYCLQFKYNPLFKKPEKSVIPYCKKYKIKFFAYSPFESGLLTCKYNKNEFHKEDGRRFWKKQRFEIAEEIKKGLTPIAERYSITIPALILAYLKEKSVDGIIAGARNKKQAEENLKGFEKVIEKKDLEDIDRIFSFIKL